MNILPREYSQFLDKGYWNSFFSQLKQTQPDQEFFEWYGAYADLKKVLEKLITPSQNVLNIGCGKSLLSEELQQAVGCQIVNCDYSEEVVEAMAERAKGSKSLVYEVADVFDLKYGTGTFDVVLDKGTLDAVYPEDTSENKERIEGKMLPKILDILKKTPGSKYVAVSMLQAHILDLLLNYFAQQPNWAVSVYEQVIADSNSLHPWVVSVEYTENHDGNIKVYLLGGETVVGEKEEALKEIKKVQIQARFTEQMTTLRQEQKFSLNIFDENREVRFGIDVLDSPVVKVLNKGRCGVFIVPQGKETTFLYGTEKGMSMVIEQIGMSRLILVKMVSGNTYHSLDSIKKELNPVIPKLLPKGCNPAEVPYMTDSDQLGEREYLYQDKDHIVEEVKIDDVYYRRLVINTNRGMVQSQYRLSYFNEKNPLKQHLKNKPTEKSLMTKKKGTLIGVDLEEIEEGYERAVLAGLMLLPDETVETARVLMLGGGGCVIPNFLVSRIQESDITVVEIDKKVNELAKQFFEVNESDRYRLVCEDALKFVAEGAKPGKPRYDLIIFDINGKEAQPSPAPIFLTEDFLSNLKQLLTPDGLLIFHMINNPIPAIFKSLFNPIYLWNDQLVDVLFCFRKELIRREDPLTKKQIIVTQTVQPLRNTKRLKRWQWQSEAYEGIKVYWPKAGGVFEGGEVCVEQQGQLQNASKTQLKEDMSKVNKRKTKKK